MRDDDFNELVESIEEGAKILRRETQPSRIFVFGPEQIKDIRSSTGKTQEEFARMMGVSVKTLRNWEQGRRKPTGPAMALLTVASKFPKIITKALHV